MLKKYSGYFGQATIEFILAIIMVVFMVYAVIKVFYWSGMEMAKLQIDHEETLSEPLTAGWDNHFDGPLKQVDPYFHAPLKIRAVWVDE